MLCYKANIGTGIPFPWNCGNTDLFERNANHGVGAPYGMAMMVYAIDNDDKAFWNAYCRRYLQSGAGFRNISDRAFKLRCFITHDDEGRLQHTSSHAAAFFVHPLSSQLMQVRWQASSSSPPDQLVTQI